MKTKDNLQQEGGNHYERLKVEPIKVFVAFNFNWFQGEILKYASRFQYKNGEQDLCKAIHISSMAVDLKIGQNRRNKVLFTKLLNKRRPLDDLTSDFVDQFDDYKEYMSILLIGLVEENYSFVKETLEKLKKKFYG